MPQAEEKRLNKLKRPDKMLTVTSSPHAHSGLTVPYIMWTVFATLVPAALVGVYFFGFGAVKVLALSVLGCIAVEAGVEKLLKKPVTVTDGSAAVTGLLLAMNLPAGAPWYVCVIGAGVAIGVGKQVYGGLGHNIFNPALVARVFLLISFPAQMTTWPVPKPLFGEKVADTITGATPLGAVKEQVLSSGAFHLQGVTTSDMLLGNIGGCMGEVSALALLLGAAWLFYKKLITWHVPLTYIGTVAAMTTLFHVLSPERYPGPVFHLLTGGLILGAFFMATDMVTTPISKKGQVIFGLGCGIITVTIRLWGGYPEGVSFAILLMNAATPLIDRWTLPKKFGFVPAPKKGKEAAA